jgi:two-component system, sensor histidine kinase
MSRSVDILMVDDRDEGLLALEAVLKDPRFNLVKARSGREALGLLEGHDFAVILLDVQMPGMDGFETARQIRQKPQFSHTPLIFVTAINQEDSSYLYRGYEDVKAVDYIFKPFDGRILHSKVSVLVDLYMKSKIIEEQNLLLRESDRQERVLRLAQLEVEGLKRYQNLADSIPHIVWRAKANGTMDYFNRGWTTYTGLSTDQSSGNGWQAAFQMEDLREFLRIWMNAMGKGEDFQVECRIRGANGRYRWHWLSAVAERDVAGEVIAWLGTCTDIHKRKYMELKLIDATKEADAASQAKSNFLANMSHEIRTPLNSIMGFTDLMLISPPEPSEQKKNLEFIKRNGQQLLKIIDEILDISKVETGRLEIENVETDLLVLLGDLQTLVQVQGQEKDLEVNFRCLTSIPRKVIIDPTRYRQILLNIINNAVKFTRVGKVDVDFSWERRDSNNGVLVCDIADTGIGIDSDNIAKLFHPFMQVDSSMTRKFGGAGLGLALSRRLAKAMGGNVELKSSEKGKGSTFTVKISTAVAGGSPLINKFVAEAKPEEAQYSQEMEKDLLHDVKVLVVDDSSDNRILMSHFLKAAGAKVELANDGQEALDKIKENEYQVVLMDIQMPVLDGYRATLQLRQQGYKKPIIALTAHALREDRDRSLKAGCSDHITKPVDRSLLLKKVAKFAGSEMQLS